MKHTLPRAVQQFVTLVREKTGNVVPTARYGFLEELLHRRVRSRGQPDLASYVHRLAVGELADEWSQLIPLITIKESYFFRAPQQFRALTRTVLPRLLRARAGVRKLTIWSAACARGEEPATLAMVLAESGLLGNWEWRIDATDVDEEALASAERGIYGDRAVAQVPPELLRRYFTPRGNLFELSASLRQRIRYRRLNLAELPYQLSEDRYDLIFLRNVLIYFRRPLQRRVVTQAQQHLSKKGYLFLGASETLWQIHEGLHSSDLDICFCYRHPQPGEKPPTRPPRLAVAPVQRPAAQPGPRSERPSEPRATKASERASRPVSEPEPVPAPEPVREPQRVAELAADVPSFAPCALQQRLAEAARELATNELSRAREILEEVLRADPSEPAAHALEGFLHDLEHRPDDAVTSYRSALYLDPALFQARVLLADCLLRLGHRERARQQFRQVLGTLDGGRERELVALDALPLPTRQRAERRCRQVLRTG